jgi:DNA mismatch repair protein MSH6
MSIKETVGNSHSPPTFGICFVDTATAEFNIAQFTDDLDRTQFETIIAQTRPKEMVLEKGLISKATLKILRNTLSNTQYNYLAPGIEFWNADITLDELVHTEYFSNETCKDDSISVKGRYFCHNPRPLA